MVSVISIDDYYLKRNSLTTKDLIVYDKTSKRN